MMKNPTYYLLLLILFSCSKPSPQLPANKGGNIDTVGLTMRILNERVIAHEDSILSSYVVKTDSNFKRNDLGFWYKINKSTNNSCPKPLESCKISYSIYALDTNELLTKKSEVIRVGKKQTILGIEELIKTMHKGEIASLIVPWYLAYGMKGDGENIIPYMSLRIYIELHQ